MCTSWCFYMRVNKNDLGFEVLYNKRDERFPFIHTSSILGYSCTQDLGRLLEPNCFFFFHSTEIINKITFNLCVVLCEYQYSFFKKQKRNKKNHEKCEKHYNETAVFIYLYILWCASDCNRIWLIKLKWKMFCTESK